MKKSLIITILLNICLIGVLLYLVIDSDNLKKVKKELKESNDKLTLQISELQKTNEIKKKEIQQRDLKINALQFIIDEKLVTISALKKEIKAIKDYKNSTEFKSLVECQGNYNDLKENCFKIEETNNEFDNLLNLCFKQKEEMKLQLTLQYDIIQNKDEEINLQSEKIINYEIALKKLEIAYKKPKIVGSIVKIGIGVAIGFIVAKKVF